MTKRRRGRVAGARPPDLGAGALRESRPHSRLPCGVFLGRKLQQLDVHGLTLTKSGYQAAECLPRHSHELAFFSVVVAGSYIEQLGARRRERPPYSVGFHPPGEVHAEEFHPSRSSTLGIELSPRWMERLQEADVALDASRVWNDGPPQWIAMRLARELEAGDEASALAIEGLVLELAAETTRAQRTRRPPRWLAQVEERLRADSVRPSLTALGELTGVHPVHIARTFRRWHGCTCGEFVRRLRLDDARARLAKGAETLIHIAHASGFCDQSHFTRCFKQATGLTPGEYRARTR